MSTRSGAYRGRLPREEKAVSSTSPSKQKGKNLRLLKKEWTGGEGDENRRKKGRPLIAGRAESPSSLTKRKEGAFRIFCSPEGVSYSGETRRGRGRSIPLYPEEKKEKGIGVSFPNILGEGRSVSGHGGGTLPFSGKRRKGEEGLIDFNRRRGRSG